MTVAAKRNSPFFITPVIRHEIGIHEGLEKSFGKEAKQALLFDVWDSFADTDLMKKLLADYDLDEEFDGDVPDDIKLEAAEEYLARLNETYGHDLKEIFADNINEISEWAQRHGYDFNDLVTRDQMTADWIQDSGYTPDMPNALQRFLARVRFWLRQHGFYNANISDRDLVYMLSEITRAGYEKRWNEKEWAQRESNGDVRNGSDENGENGTRFSVNENSDTIYNAEMQNILNQYDRTKGYHRAPNGKASQLTLHQWLQVRTEAFKKWYGDWELATLLNNARKAWNDNNYNFTYRFVPSEKLKQRLEYLLGHEVGILQLDGSTVRHIRNEHSDVQGEASIGQKARTADDLVLLPYLLNNFDNAEFSSKHDDNLGNRAITITKQINGIAVVCTIERGKRGVYVVTHWQHVSAVQMQNTPGRNALSDADKIKIQQDIAKIKSDAENFSNIVDKNGEPMVVYHGSSADFTVFDHKFAMRNGAAEGRGFYFTSDREKAEGFKTENGKLFEVYLSIQKPLNPDELTITRAEVEKIIRLIDTDGTYVADYAEDGIGYPGKAWHDKAVKRAAQMIYESSDTNADIVAEIYMVFGQGNALAKITEATGYDGFIKDDVYVVFTSNQVKSATDNIGTFDKNNPDIRYSVRDNLDPETRAMIELFIPIIQEVDMDNVENDTLAEKFNEKYAAKLGYSIDGGTAHMYAFWAEDVLRKEGKERADKAKRERAYFWYGEMNPFFGFFTEHVGSGVINPGKRFWGQDATGSFISEKFKRNTVLRRQNPTEKINAYLRYKERRQNALKGADGFNLDELAQAYCDRYGGDPVEVEDEMFEFFRHLKKTDITKEYNQYHKEMNRQADLEAAEEYARLEQEKIEEEVMNILQRGEPITQEWIKENRKVFDELSCSDYVLTA